ncbi:insulinase family protein [Streptacidiphilus sp. PAMC 29251]
MRTVEVVAPGLAWCEDGGDTGSVTLAFPAGFRAEGAGRAGLAHFAEHMLMAPRDSHASPYAQLEDQGFLLEAQTRRDHLSVGVCGPQEHLLRALELLVSHVGSPGRPAGTVQRQSEVIRNEVLEKTRLAPWSDRWRWRVATSHGAIGVDHDPIVTPAMNGSAVHGDVWEEFIADKVRPERCGVAVVANPSVVAPADVESVLGPRSPAAGAAVPSLRADGGTPAGEPARGDELVIPVFEGDLAGQSAALAAAMLVARAVAGSTGSRCGPPWYGLFDEWFSEDAPTTLVLPLPPGTAADVVEECVGNAHAAAFDQRRLDWCHQQLTTEWDRRVETSAACSRHTAAMLLGDRIGVPFAGLVPEQVARNVAAAVTGGSG